MSDAPTSGIAIGRPYPGADTASAAVNRPAQVLFASLIGTTINFAGIVGASLAPYIATWLAQHYGLQYVGYYLTVAALFTLAGLLAVRETKDAEL